MRAEKDTGPVYGAWCSRDDIGSAGFSLLVFDLKPQGFEEGSNEESHLLFAFRTKARISVGIDGGDLNEGLKKLDDRIHEREIANLAF